MTFFFIIVGTLIAGVGSVFIANFIAWKIMARFSDYLLSFAAGTLLSTACLNLIPESFEISSFNSELMSWLLAGIIFFFLLDKIQLYHHGHEHSDFSKSNGQNSSLVKKSSASILLFGDALHCFGDGMLIASAFIANWKLGVLSTLAVLAHEIPHHIGDLVVISKSLSSRQDALKKVAAAGFFAVLGGGLGFIFLDIFRESLPYFLILASSSFIYVSLADLIPQLQKKTTFIETIYQLLWLSFGVLCISSISHIAH